MKLLREYIRELLREEPGRSYHTPNMDPMDVMEQEGFRVSSYIDINSGNTHVTIEEYDEKTDHWNEVYEKVFENAEEAMFWMNNQAQIYQRKKFSQDVEIKPDGP
jgi:arginine/ornithine N-succinyltransferase beta subunit